MTDLLDDLAWRGLIHQSTHPEELRQHLQTPRRVYAGFDPSADSLTIGNLVPLLLLRRFQLAGHSPVVVMGGGTGLIGDPSGKEAERPLSSEDVVAANVKAHEAIYRRVLSFEGDNAARLTNNLDWIGQLSFLDVLRGPGKHFSVNAMIQRDSVRSRLEGREQGISYTEFSYMVIQAYDFYWLAKELDVSVQLGGSDQWGNIVAGTDLIRRSLGRECYGLTVPLVTKADGGKFGKTESGAVWLTSPRTSPYMFYQFWLNAADADLEGFFKVFTLLPQNEIKSVLAEHHAAPEKRVGQELLALHVTDLLHGAAATEQAHWASAALFGGDVSRLPAELVDEVFANAPSSQHRLSDLEGDGLSIVDLLVQAKIARSKRDARELLGAGAVRVNGERAEENLRLTPASLLHNELALIRKGRKTWHVARFAGHDRGP